MESQHNQQLMGLYPVIFCLDRICKIKGHWGTMLIVHILSKQSMFTQFLAKMLFERPDVTVNSLISVAVVLIPF